MARVWSEWAANPKVILWTAQKLFSFKLLKYTIKIKIRHYFQDVFEMFIDFLFTICSRFVKLSILLIDMNTLKIKSKIYTGILIWKTMHFWGFVKRYGPCWM